MSRHAAETVLSVRRGLHIVPKQLYGKSLGRDRRSALVERDVLRRAAQVGRGGPARRAAATDYLPEPDHLGLLVGHGPLGRDPQPDRHAP
ncbi:hypothetical protein LV779_07600 [Streptomyces thinghirensis]|nr:hypothetical protein [Streptomyces thinghirensis]